MNDDSFQSIIEHQKDQIKKVLKFDKETGLQLSEEEKECVVWKILILDKQCNITFNTILKKGDIRKGNVIKAYSLWEERGPLPHVCAIYVIDPTDPASMDKLYMDFSKSLYDTMAITFTQPIKPGIIAKIASEAIKYNVHNKIYSMSQCYLQYRSLTNCAFTLDIEKSYSNLMDANADTVAKHIDAVASRLYCFLRGNNLKPYIVYFSNDIVSDNISKALINAIRSDTNENDDISERIVLFLFNREFDVYSMLHHSWLYLPLIHDIIGIKENSILLEKKEKLIKSDLDFYKDELLKKYELQECGAVKKDIDEQYMKCNQEYTEMQAKAKSQQSADLSILRDFSEIKQRKEQ